MATAPKVVQTSAQEPAVGSGEDNFSAAFDALANLKDGEEYTPPTAKKDEPAPTEKTPEQLAAENEARGTGAGAGDGDGDGDGITVGDAVERPVAPTHDEKGVAFTPEQIAAEQARLDKEFDDAETAKAEAKAAAQKIVDDAKKPDDPVERLADLLTQRQQPKVEQPAPARQPAAPAELFTAEEKALLTEYDKEWADVSKAEMLRRRGEYHHLTNYIFAEVTKSIQPIMDMVAALAERTHVGDLTTKITNYDVDKDKVLEWIENQPSAIMKAAYTQIAQQGTADEVAELFDRYRKETGTATPAPKTPTPPTPAPKAPTPAAVAAAAKLAPTPSKRTAPVAGVAKDDFDGAFAEAAKNVA